MAYSKFQKGSGCFKCQSCGKFTRQTEGRNDNECYCIDCIENQEKHNSFVDNGKEKECDCKDCKKVI